MIPIYNLIICLSHLLLVTCETNAGNSIRQAYFTGVVGTKMPASTEEASETIQCARKCTEHGGECSFLSINASRSDVCLLNNCDRNSNSAIYRKNVQKVPFLRRQDGSLDFDRNWADYKSGFGNLDGEFWMGLDKLHQMTSSQNYGLLVELLDGDLCRFAVYDRIVIANESDRYRLSVSGFQSHSTAGDSIIINHGYGPINGAQFSTPDYGPVSPCGTLYKAGWWYDWCYDACGTCLYDAPDPFNEGGVHWYSAMNDWRSFTYTEWSLVKY